MLLFQLVLKEQAEQVLSAHRGLPVQLEPVAEVMEVYAVLQMAEEQEEQAEKEETVDVVVMVQMDWQLKWL